jgi:hypothetical protein
LKQVGTAIAKQSWEHGKCCSIAEERELETPPFFPAAARNFRDEARVEEGGKIEEK